MKNKIIIKKLNLKDVNNRYLDWMNDLEVTKFTEQRFKKHSLSDIKKFVKEKNNSKTEYLFGIFINQKSTLIHIGNIKLGPIDKFHRSAEVSYIIGDKNFWKKGIGSKAVKLLIKVAKKQFQLKKLIAGCYGNNYGSIKVLKRNLFKKEASLKSQVIFGSKRVNKLIFGLLI
tara:strand:- start:75 stop:590 length:516 start_codon:yes stop_codon:yes gene_type:complete